MTQPRRTLWSAEEREALRSAIVDAQLALHDASAMVGRSYAACKHKARDLGIVAIDMRIYAPPPTPSDWWDKDGRTKALCDAVAMGMTSRQIAEAMGTSRNAVIGKAHRLGLQWHHGPPHRPEVPAHRPYETMVAAYEMAGRLGCLWPSGDPQESDFTLCCARRVPGRSYCQQHMEVAYEPPR